MPLATKKNTLSYLKKKKKLFNTIFLKKLKEKEKPKTVFDKSIVSNHLWFQMHDANSGKIYV